MLAGGDSPPLDVGVSAGTQATPPLPSKPIDGKVEGVEVDTVVLCVLRSSRLLWVERNSRPNEGVGAVDL